ncbi:SulP family inorganic anion transporter [Myxococcus sp. K15C18031901]|uniref:SulP family inorganic anion transporter n=1 Tax=Myxococcus dinghuensis TaxID=2906761 RepID=UPI0020A727C5|nr:SulP family inorganic anion transporter [Myxococcus dinghuensis]MCP3100939.1 SulP family inorganic anion transporter [Myxococcus dinghuensis]
MERSPSAVCHSSGTPGRASWKGDLVSGFLVFLIALPLCLGIAMASGFPPVAGILTAVVGGVVSSWLGSAALTIKGPAAGLIVIALGAVTELGQGDAGRGYRRALATIVVAAGLQVVFAALRAGRLGDFFPSSVVHGMLAAIGVIICAKQVHVLLGVAPVAKEPLRLLAEIPSSVSRLNPEIALIGALALGLLFGHAALARRLGFLKRVPAPLLVLLVTVPLGLAFDLEHPHTFTFSHAVFSVGPGYLVNLPGNLLTAVTFPDFSDVLSATSLKYILMFALVGSIESLLTVKAVDLMDPERRRSNMDKDLLATGVGNLVAGLLGGLPMISEVVRSTANIGYGARTRLSNFFHGLFLLSLVAFAPMLIHRIPLAALAGMLIFTGVRLASPGEWVKTLRIGVEQLLVFTVTLGVTLATDLLVGVASGIVVEAVVNLLNGAPARGFFRPDIQEQVTSERVVLRVRGAAVFTNFLALKKRLSRHPRARRIDVDLSEARLVDHTVMQRFQELAHELAREGRTLGVRGLEHHRGLSPHPLAARKKSVAPGLELTS